MSKAIKDLREQLKGEAGRTEARVAELQQSILLDHEVLDTFVERFTIAVQDGAGEQELARLEAQRNEALKRVEQNEEIIRILTTSVGSKIQRLRADLVGEHFKAIAEIEEKAAALHAKLQLIRAQLIKGALELEALNEEQIDHLKRIDNLHLDRKDQERFGIAEYRESDGQKRIAGDLNRRTVATMIHSLQFKPFVDHQ